MELKEAKHILESLGYNIKNPFMNEETQYLTELMARFNGNYTGRFKGLQDAGDVTIQLAKGNKTEEVAGAMISITIGGEVVDGIQAAQILNNVEGTIYNLNGQKVSNAQKGIFIQNGKKVVKK